MSERPVAVSAVCRGVVVGQELVSPAVFQRESAAGGPEVVVPVADTAEGVIRLTAYDYGVQPPTPVAERLVFRRPVRKLSIQPSQDASRHKPGDSVRTGVLRARRTRPPAVRRAGSVGGGRSGLESGPGPQCIADDALLVDGANRRCPRIGGRERVPGRRLASGTGPGLAAGHARLAAVCQRAGRSVGSNANHRANGPSLLRRCGFSHRGGRRRVRLRPWYWPTTRSKRRKWCAADSLPCRLPTNKPSGGSAAY